GPAAVWPANAAVPPIADDGIRRRFGRSQSRSCLLSNRVPNESRPPRWIRPRAVPGAPSPTAQTIPLTDTPLPNWSGTLAPFPANSTVAPSALRTPSWRRSQGACRRSTECARLRSHARHTPRAVARSKSRWRFPTEARRASAAGASSHSPAPVSDNANSACVCRHAALRLSRSTAVPPGCHAFGPLGIRTLRNVAPDSRWSYPVVEWLISSSVDESRSVQLQINPTRWRSAILLVGCLAAPVPLPASPVQSPCDASCSAPTSGRAQNAPCLSFSERFCLGFQQKVPSDAKGLPPPIHPRISPILPIDSAIEPLATIVACRMRIQIESEHLNGLVVLSHPDVFEDERGF